MENLTPVSELMGDWTITGEITKGTCTVDGETTTYSEDTENEPSWLGIKFDITISETECKSEGPDEYEDDDGTIASKKCAAGDNQVMIVQSWTIETDKIFSSTINTFNLSYDSLADTLSGSYTITMDASGEFYDDNTSNTVHHNGHCDFTGTATGKRIEEDTENSADTHIDNDVTDPLSNGTSTTDDYDNDGIIDAMDNCWTMYNPLQTNSDGDHWGDVCEYGVDTDVDGLCDSAGSALCTEIDPDDTKKTKWFYVDPDLTVDVVVFFVAGTYEYLQGFADSENNIIVDGIISDSEIRTYQKCPGNDVQAVGICLLTEVKTFLPK